jgi:hypothetical protein
LRKWETHELTRLRRVLGDIAYDVEIETKNYNSKNYFSKRLETYDDDVEKENGEEEFYRDR